MKETKPYKLPERYSLEISEDTTSFRIKDLHRNVTSDKYFLLSELVTVIREYETSLEKLKTFGSFLNEDNDVDIIIKPGSKYILYYKGKRVNKCSSIIECIDKIKNLQKWYKEFESFKSTVNALNNREEVSL